MKKNGYVQNFSYKLLLSLMMTLSLLFMLNGCAGGKKVLTDKDLESLPKENPYKGKADAIAEGAKLYENTCAGCHGNGLEGNTCPNLKGQLKLGSEDRQMFKTIANGSSKGMPGFYDSLGNEKIWKILSFVQSKR